MEPATIIINMFIKLSLLLKYHATKTYQTVKIKPHSLISVLQWSEWSASRWPTWTVERVLGNTLN
jgi:hypothetical protein